MGKHRIVLARSGVQYYLRNELPGMGIYDVPKEFDDLTVFGVYRPADVLRRALPKLVKTPVVDGHDKVVVTGTEPYVLGYCGDTPSIRYQNGELVATSDFDITNEELMPKYRELSLGYVGKNRWAPGITKDGVPYQLMCDNIERVEHLAFVPRARGGAGMRVLDGAFAMAKKAGNALRELVYKKNGMTLDAATSWDEIITQLKTTEGLNDVDVEVYTNGLIGCLNDVEQSENKDQLLRYLADLPVLYDEPHDIWVQTVDTVDSLYKSLTGGNGMDEPTPSEDKPVDQPPAAPEPAPAPAPASPANDAIDKVLNTLVTVVDKLTTALSQINTPAPTPVVQAPAAEPPAAEQPTEPSKKDSPKPEADGDSSAPPSGDAVTTDGAAPEVVVVTKGDVVTENEAVATTEVPPAAGGEAAEAVMTPEGVVDSDTGALRNQADVCPECGQEPCACPPKEEAPQTTVVNVNIPPFTGDAMPAINMQAPSSGVTSSLDDMFMKMKSRR